MFEYRAVWAVPGGGTGYSVYHVRESPASPIGQSAQIFADALANAMDDIAALLPNEVSISFESEALELDVESGQLQSVLPITAPDTVEGTSTSGWAAPCGARVDHITTAIVAGRRLRGRTYLVPLADTVYGSDTGAITPQAAAIIDAAFESLRDDTANYSLGVWSRTHGVIADVAACSTANEAAILRGRRD